MLDLFGAPPLSESPAGIQGLPISLNRHSAKSPLFSISSVPHRYQDPPLGSKAYPVCGEILSLSLPAGICDLPVYPSLSFLLSMGMCWVTDGYSECIRLETSTRSRDMHLGTWTVVTCLPCWFLPIFWYWFFSLPSNK